MEWLHVQLQMQRIDRSKGLLSKNCKN